MILLDPVGEPFRQPAPTTSRREPHLVFLCPRYEGVDERVRALVDRELSIGDYVLTGGELGALVIIDAVLRLLPGAIDEASTAEESFAAGLLEYPQFTRPAEFEAGPCRRSSSRDTTSRSAAGACASRCAGPRTGGPTSSRGVDLSKDEAKAMAELRAEAVVDAHPRGARPRRLTPGHAPCYPSAVGRAVSRHAVPRPAPPAATAAADH